MAFGLPGYNITPLNYSGKDGILFHLKDDMSVFLKLSSTTDMTFNSQMDVTTQPVQTGQVITDNVQEKPNTIAINGVVVVGYEGAFFLTENTTVVEDFVATMQTWRSQRQIMRVLCKDGITLENAVCTQFEAKKDKSIANGLNISLTFQDVNFVAQIGRTQSPNANQQNSTANGSKTHAKTKDGAVSGKKQPGKTGTFEDKPRSFCKTVEERLDRNDQASWLEGAMGGCNRTNSLSSVTKSGVRFNEKEGLKYAPNSVKQAYGFNINKG